MLRHWLLHFGFSGVEEAEGAVQALDKLAEAQRSGAPFAAVFCECELSSVSGIELLSICRSTPVYQSLPFLMMSKQATRKYVLSARQLGASDYVVKPFTETALREKLLRLELMSDSGD